MGKKKGGYTPAEISKKYQVNEYIDVLKDEKADDIAKRTAHQMLKNNTQKLAYLAIAQESLKNFENGIQGMNLVDLVEMICDWKAATLRHENGDIFKSIEMNQNRFGYSDELKQIFINTVNDFLSEV
jgi:hypothetical protein